MSSTGEDSTTLNVQQVSQVTFLATTWAATALSFLFLVFRLVVRVQSFHKLQSDDWLVIGAWLMLLVFSISWQVEAYFLHWMHDVLNGKTLPTEAFYKQYTTFLPFIVAWSYLYYSSIWAVKLSFLIFFRRLGSKVKSQQIWWRVVLLLTVGAWIACVADIDYKCTLGDLDVIQTVCPTPSHINWQNHVFYGNAAADVITDLLILSIPVTLLWNVQIPLRNKIILFAVFSATVFIILVSIIRVTLVKGTQQQLKEPGIDWMFLWSAVEMGTSIAVASVGSLRQLFVSKKESQMGLRPKTNGSQRARLFKVFFSHFTRVSSRNYGKKASREDFNNISGQLNDTNRNYQPHEYVAPLKSVHIQTGYEVTSTHAHPAPWLDGATNAVPLTAYAYDEGGYYQGGHYQGGYYQGGYHQDGYHQGNHTWARA